MIQYIDKAAVVEEIKKRIKETESMRPKFDHFWAGQISTFRDVLKILDTLEVKEVDSVDLDKGIEKELGTRWCGEYLDTAKFKESAEYFFELGRKAQKGE